MNGPTRIGGDAIRAVAELAPQAIGSVDGARWSRLPRDYPADSNALPTAIDITDPSTHLIHAPGLPRHL
jgi:hypothetical protein